MTDCRGCGHATQAVLDLGNHYLPDFPEPGAPRGPAYPLRLEFCPGCTLLQLAETTPRHELYHERYGYRSGVNEAIRADLAGVVRYALDARPAPRNWLDIASNDGTLLSGVPRHVHRTGVDPLTQFAEEARQHADRIVNAYFDAACVDGLFDVITSVSMFYDLDDPGRFAREVASVLAPGGVWVIQQNYAGHMLERNAVDNICHEHVTYFTLTALMRLLAKHSLEITDVAWSDVNGGCIRTLVTHAGDRAQAPSVAAALEHEARAGLHKAAIWQQWGLGVTAELAKTRQMLEDADAAGERVMVYGASTRGGTILQMINAGPALIEAAVERQPAKVGKVMAAAGLPIISEEQMRADPPEWLLVSPWFFRSVFTAREAAYLRGGGRMVFPLPEFEVVGA